MRTESFSGTHREIGKQQGERYNHLGTTFQKAKIDPLHRKRQIDIYKSFFPAFLDECKGIAEATETPLDNILDTLLVLPLLGRMHLAEPQKGCTIFGVQNNRGTFVGRNYDWTQSTEKTWEEYEVHTGEKRYVAITDMGVDQDDPDHSNLFYDPEDLVNDEGLYIGLTFAYDLDWNYGLAPTHIMQLIAETCTTVQEALAVFDRVPVCGPKNFFIADANGDMAVVEHTSKKHKVILPDDGVLIHTNHFLDRTLAEEDTVLEDRPANDTYIRYYEALQQINKDKEIIDISWVEGLLKDRHFHICEKGKEMETIWSLAMEMTQKEAFLSDGFQRDWLDITSVS